MDHITGWVVFDEFFTALREGISYLSNDPCSWNNIISKTINLARSKSTPPFAQIVRCRTASNM